MTNWIPNGQETDSDNRHEHQHHIQSMHADGIGTNDVASFAIAKPH